MRDSTRRFLFSFAIATLIIWMLTKSGKKKPNVLQFTPLKSPPDYEERDWHIVNLYNLMSYADPSQYKGPIIEGWPPSRDRSMLTYIRPEENTVVNDISCIDIPGTN